MEHLAESLSSQHLLNNLVNPFFDIYNEHAIAVNCTHTSKISIFYAQVGDRKDLPFIFIYLTMRCTAF
jgi:hypothetical protein